MAIHTNLPIYRDAYRLFDVVMELQKNMPREFKPSVGFKLRDECIEILTLVFRANTMRDRVGHLLDLIEHLSVAELLLRFACDKRLISKAQYAAAIELTTNVGKQANGWRRAATSPAS
ncbi:MAG: four helix bundle protein [Betaproteobacteria bacterium]|nr:four helix bundle protein [Betaproteobacteria bacterium]